MVKGYKTINIKEELIEKIRDADENKKEVEEGTFNLAGFVTKVLSQHLNNTYSEPPKNTGLTIQQIKNVVKEALNEKNKVISATSNNEGERRLNETTYNGLTSEDLKSIKEVVGQAIAEAMSG